MKTIKLEKSKYNSNHYLPLTTDLSDWDKDHSGTYVLLTEAEAEIAALRERQRVLVQALKQLEWSGYDDYTQGNNCPICKAGSPQRWKHKKKCFIGAALAAKEG